MAKKATVAATPTKADNYSPKINDAILIPINDLQPHEGNPNVMSDKELGALMRGIKEKGFDEPLQVVKREGKYMIVGGHHRWKAAKLLGFTELPCCVYDWNDRKAMEEMVSRNLIRGSLDHEKFGGLLASYLKGEKDFKWEDLVTAFAVQEQDLFKATRASDDLKVLLQSTKSVDELPTTKTNEAGVPNAISKKGDIFVMGSKDGRIQKIMCGDSTSADDIAKLMGDDRASLLSTDPPYGVDYTGVARPKSKEGKTKGKDWTGIYHEIDIVDYGKFLKDVFGACAKFVLPRCAWYVWYADRRRKEVDEGLESVGVRVHQQIVWVKPSPVATYSYYPWQHEPAIYGFKMGEHDEPPPINKEAVLWYMNQHEMGSFGWKVGEKPPHQIDSDRHLTTVWHVDYDGKGRQTGAGHPTQKPVRLFEIPMIHHTQPGAICLEPFSGSGTSIMAGERMGRQVRAMEISPVFVDLAVSRWQAYTGEMAECITRPGVVIPIPPKEEKK